MRWVFMPMRYHGQVIAVIFPVDLAAAKPDFLTFPLRHSQERLFYHDTGLFRKEFPDGITQSCRYPSRSCRA